MSPKPGPRHKCCALFIKTQNIICHTIYWGSESSLWLRLGKKITLVMVRKDHGCK